MSKGRRGGQQTTSTQRKHEFWTLQISLYALEKKWIISTNHQAKFLKYGVEKRKKNQKKEVKPLKQ